MWYETGGLVFWEEERHGLPGSDDEELSSFFYGEV